MSNPNLASATIEAWPERKNSQYWINLKKEMVDVWKYRNVVISYVHTNLRVRYRKSFLGFLWSVLAPLMSYLVIGLVFSMNAKTKMDHFFLYMFSGSVFFNFISACITRSPSIMIDNENYLKKIYVPKLTFILNGLFLELTNFSLSVAALSVLGLVSGAFVIRPSWIVLPIPVFLAAIGMIGVCCLMSIAGVFFRDLIHIVPVVMQTLFFLTPVMYQARDFDNGLYSKLMYFNPIYHFIEFFRTPIVTGEWPAHEHVMFCSVFAPAVFIIGFLVLKKLDNRIVFKL